jgi:hypothetical protein
MGICTCKVDFVIGEQGEEENGIKTLCKGPSYQILQIFIWLFMREAYMKKSVYVSINLKDSFYRTIWLKIGTTFSESEPG